MKKYTDGTKVILATEKAFEVIYKKLGFKILKEKKSSKKVGDE